MADHTGDQPNGSARPWVDAARWLRELAEYLPETEQPTVPEDALVPAYPAAFGWLPLPPNVIPFPRRAPDDVATERRAGRDRADRRGAGGAGTGDGEPRIRVHTRRLPSPRNPGQPEIPLPRRIPGAHLDPRARRTPQAPQVPQAPKTPQVPPTPQVPNTPETPGTPDGDQPGPRP